VVRRGGGQPFAVDMTGGGRGHRLKEVVAWRSLTRVPNSKTMTSGIPRCPYDLVPEYAFPFSTLTFPSSFLRVVSCAPKSVEM
jgi:hypothetical protein